MNKNTKVILIVIASLLSLIFIFAVAVYLDYKGIINIPGNPVSNYFAEQATEESMEEAIEESTGEDADVEIDQEDGSISIETEEGSYYSGEVSSWPTDIPSAFPEFEGGDIEYATKSEYQDGISWILTFNNVSSSNIDTFKSTLTANGFEIESDISIANSRLLTAGKGDYSLLMTYDNANNEAALELSDE